MARAQAPNAWEVLIIRPSRPPRKGLRQPRIPPAGLCVNGIRYFSVQRLRTQIRKDPSAPSKVMIAWLSFITNTKTNKGVKDHAKELQGRARRRANKESLEGPIWGTARRLGAIAPFDLGEAVAGDRAESGPVAGAAQDQATDL